MEDLSATLLAALKKPSTAVDQKIQLFNQLKSGIKHNRVPESCQAPIFECVRIAIVANTSAVLVTTGFSTLSHFIKRLVLQQQTSVITSQLSKLLPILLERLGDARESHRNAASSILADLWPLAHTEVEVLIRENALKGNNARAKEAAMQFIVRVCCGLSDVTHLSSYLHILRRTRLRDCPSAVSSRFWWRIWRTLTLVCERLQRRQWWICSGV